MSLAFSNTLASSCYEPASLGINFTLFNGNSTFDQAVETCDGFGGSLARIDSIEEFNFVFGLIRETSSPDTVGNFWIGEN